ncbi:TPA_asm: phenazine biosynthesis protein PhzF, partial [Listeria monocytogenes]|nr:phenazine biosynthesis protein PhzF [Listeria monocytogenes]
LVKLDVNVHSEIARVYVGGNGYYCETKYLSIE